MTFKKMADILKPVESKNFMVSHFEVGEKEVQAMRLHDLINGRTEYYGFEPGKYARLSHRNEDGSRGATIMSDTWMEQRTNMDLVRYACGDVLIAGLGIGMVLLYIQEMAEVRSIKVIEKEVEVIGLVAPQLPLNDKVSIINADIFEYEPDESDRFNVIYFDIWDTISRDNLKEMNKLHRRFRPYLKEGGWMGSWRREDCRKG